jgi:hypothetical protein
MERDCEVLNEEMITHPTVVHKVNGWRAEARIMVLVKIGSETYECEKIVSLRLKKHESED